MRKIYTYNECKEIALQYQTRQELKEKNPSIYVKINRNKWGSELFSHMKRLDYKEKILSYEDCKKIISKYKYLKDFRINEQTCYLKISRNKWNDLLKNLIPSTDNLLKRCVYAYEFKEQNTAYIGLTYSIKTRNNEHHTKGTVFKFAKENNINEYEPIVLKENIPYSDSKFYENFYIEEYQKKGWKILNIAPAGSLGGKTIKDDKIVYFKLNGDFISYGTISKISKKLKIPKRLIRKCLRKENKSTMNYIFMLYNDWIEKESPKKIEPHIIPNKEEKIVLLNDKLEVLNICKNKKEAMKYCKITSTNNNIANLKHYLILNSNRQYKCCYYDDYINYINGKYKIYKPDIPKCKKIVFIPNTINNIPEFINSIIDKKQWEKTRLSKRKK